MRDYVHSPEKSLLPHGSHQARHQHPSPPYEKNPPSVLPAKGPLLSFPTLVIGNPESSLPDVSFSDFQRFPEVMVGPGTSGVGAERPLFDADP